MPYRSIPLLICALVAGCAEPGHYPSLLPRSAEQQSFAEPAAPPPAPVTADPALDARIATARGALDAVAKTTDAALARAEKLARAASGKPAGSDAWLDAQVALADLDAVRSSNVAALSDLEQLASDRAVTLAPDYAPLTQAIEAARAAVAAQTARITAIQGLLAPA